MDDLSFELVKDIFNIINKPINSREDLLNMRINNTYLRSDMFKTKIIKMIPKLKQKYKSHTLTCLHNNSLDKQKFPTINMIRQILKCNNLKLQPFIMCKGYDPITHKKLLERYFDINEITPNEITPNEIIPNEINEIDKE